MLTQALLDRIDAVDHKVQAYLTVTKDDALRQAQSADQRRTQGGEAPLLGVPLAIKDVLATKGIETTCGSKILRGFKPPYTATAVTRLQEAGAVLLGKVNCDEFAMGSSNENSGYFPTHNPWTGSRIWREQRGIGRYRRWLPTKPLRPWAPIPAAVCASRLPSVASLG
ncbi:MAG: amidase [Caldilineaceae bacterium]